VQPLIRIVLLVVVVAIAHPAIAQTDDRRSNETQETHMSATRAAWLIGGLSASATAAGFMWSKEQDLKAKLQQVQRLPAGAPEWQSEYAEARKMIGARDFLGAVAVGVGAVTVIALATTGRPPSASARPGTAIDHAQKRRTWTLGISPVLRDVSLAWSF
jgi:hypothetical protein